MLDGLLNQKATVWKLGPPTEWGPGGWESPTVIDVRWQDKQQLIRSKDGTERMSQAVIYTETPIDLGGRVYLGETTEADPANVLSYEPMGAEQMVDLDGSTVGWKVFV